MDRVALTEPPWLTVPVQVVTESLLKPSDASPWILSYNEDRNTVLATINANAVPEPAAWVLLLLGAFGLMKLRKH